MFKFQLFTNNSCKDKEDEEPEKECQLDWFPARKIEISSKLCKQSCESIKSTKNVEFCNLSVKLVDPKKVVLKLTEENCENIVEAESQHSDLLPAKYEGGLKIWEGSFDLANYLLSEKINLKNKRVLDLGCGAGIIGIIASLQECEVHFQDYNVEVIEYFTIPNILLNHDDYETVKERCEFYCGDWKSFTNLETSESENKKYDFIFTSETIYNADNHHKLYNVFKKKLKKDGIGFVAGKTYYFGVGGGMRQFEEVILRDSHFNVKVIWKSNEGLQREILQLDRKNF